MSIYVGNLPYDVTEDELKETFGEYGTVTQIYMPLDRETGRFRGFAFVTLKTEDQESSAIGDLDGAHLMGRPIKVNQARPRQRREEKLRGLPLEY